MVFVGILISLALATSFAWVSLEVAGGGHGTYLPAKLFFPYAMLQADAARHIGQIALVISTIQYIIYGAVTVLCIRRRLRLQVLVWFFASHALFAVVAIVTATQS